MVTVSDTILNEFKLALSECRKLYVDAGQFCVSKHPELIPKSTVDFVRLMDDLHRGLLVKTYISIAEADHKWGKAEQALARELILHVWGRLLDPPELKQAIIRLSAQATKLKWYGLIRPFSEIVPLRDRVGQLETVVIRAANLIAKADGILTESESRVLRSIQQSLDSHLRDIPYGELDHTEAQRCGTKAIADLQSKEQELREACEVDPTSSSKPKSESPPIVPQVSVEDARKQLDELIGLDGIKKEIDSLVNYLALQRSRAEVGLPATPLSLHSVFTGNPGTGKTTVARIVGQILCAMNILEKGHVIETDRSGLVAEFSGQTGPKTNKKIDEAMDGILFVDEAYTLVAEGSEDPYGSEAVQALLKRMEDDRDRLIVVLAGYPQPIENLLDSNPGLRSRFSRSIHFEDYSPVDLGRILERMCSQNQYVLNSDTRARFLLGISHMHETRDEHFGNGRLVRNLFEDAIRNLANRIADQAPVTKELLTHIEPDDFLFREAPPEKLQCHDKQFQVYCPGCSRSFVVKANFLTRRVNCGCGKKFRIDWGAVVLG